jgi:hypothetical protein
MLRISQSIQGDVVIYLDLWNIDRAGSWSDHDAVKLFVADGVAYTHDKRKM